MRKLETSKVPEFSIWPLYWNQKLGKLGCCFKTSKFEWIFFIWGNWKFPRFPSFRFWLLCWNGKLEKFGIFFKTCKVKWICFVLGNYKFSRSLKGPFCAWKDCCSYEGVYVTIGNPAFCLLLYLTGVHFRGELQHFGDVSEQKSKYWPIRTREIDGVRL